MINDISDDIYNFAQNYISSVNSAYGELHEKWTSTVVSEAQKLQDIVNANAYAYQSSSLLAQEYAERANAAGDTTRGAIAEKWAAHFQAKAAAALEPIGSALSKWEAIAAPLKSMIDKVDQSGRLVSWCPRLGPVLDAYSFYKGVISLIETGETDELAKASGSFFIADLAAVIGVALFGVASTPTLMMVAIFAFGGSTWGDVIGVALKNIFVEILARTGIADPLFEMYDNFRKAITWLPSHDPLALDLDGDGLETLGQNNTLLFDHSGGNLVNGTGWVRGDDGFLALDLNGNGQIDNGSELFGVDTVMSNGQKANSGFAALADQDSNHDGKIDSNDAVFASLRVWQDSDEDAITDAGELKTLSELGITSINVTATGGATNLGNGNTTSGSATFTRADGSTGTAYNLDLTVNAYQREYQDDLPIPSTHINLPNMAGTGQVRDLLQAALRSPSLTTTLTQFSTATTRAEQMALLKTLVNAWGSAANESFYGDDVCLHDLKILVAA